MAKDFFAGLEACSQRIIQGARVGMKHATLRFEDDTITKEPRAPLDYGSLRSATSSFVDGILVSTAQYPVEPGGKTSRRITFLGKMPNINTIEGKVVCNIVQARLLHRGLRMSPSGPVTVKTWGRTRMKRGLPQAQGTGKKWISLKLWKYKREYLKLIAQQIRIAKRA
jgi:hypothetical protein